jgi:acetyltransferase EpsM
VADILRAQNEFESVQFIDDDPALQGKVVNATTVLGNVESVLRRAPSAIGVVVAIGNPQTRLSLACHLLDNRITFINAVHPQAIVVESARLGVGVMIHPGAVVNTLSRLGNHVLVNTGAIVEHEVVIEDGASVHAGARVGGRATLERACFVSMGAVVLQRCRIGAGSVVAAGSVVTRDVPPGVLVMGSPARVKEEVGPDFRWSRLL